MMNVALWISQAVVASIFAASGAAKSTMPRERLLATGQTGIAMFPMPVVRFAASMELLAAVGLVRPGLADTATFLDTSGSGGQELP